MSEVEKIIDEVQAEWVVSGLGSGTLYGDFALEVAKRATAELRAALREALDGWEEWNGAKEDADRIEFLRAQFLDDK